jgi:hypothetical protein
MSNIGKSDAKKARYWQVRLGEAARNEPRVLRDRRSS